MQGLKGQRKIKWIDLRPKLIEASRNDKVYYKYDAHWNDYGAYLAYQYVMEQLRNTIKLSPIGENDVHFIHQETREGEIKTIYIRDYFSEDDVIAKIPKSKVTFKEETTWTTWQNGFVTMTSN